MRGSDKQIKWAEEIKTNVLKTLTGYKSMAEGDTKMTAERKAAGLRMIDSMVAQINAIDYAGDMIDAFSFARFSGNAAQDMGKVIAGFKASPKLKV